MRISGQRKAGFTLIELILVMSMLIALLGLVAPALSRFFQGRTLDSEGRRFVSLAHYGRSRAVSEGMPMLLWINSKNSTYGLEAEFSHDGWDERAVDYQLGKDLKVEVQALPISAGQMTQGEQAMRAAQSTRFGQNSSVIRFQPDGFIGETSPWGLWFKQEKPGQARGTGDSIWITQSTNRVRYEIQTNSTAVVRTR